MKKTFIIIFLITIIFATTITYVFAENNPISLEGETTIAPGKTNKVIVKISSDETIGVVSGKIEYNSNISNIQVTGKNNWAVTYNKETGVFNVYKAEGANTEEIIEIQYTASNTEGTGEITLSDIKVTNINYEEKNINNVTKTITIKQVTPSNTTNQTENDTAGGTGNNTIDNTTNETSDSKNNTVTDTSKNTNNGTKTNTTNTKATTTTSGKTTLPKAGMVKAILPICIVLVTIISVGAYIGYKKYKGIN